MKKRLLGLVGISFLALVMSGQDSEDGEDPHSNQPETCNNYFRNDHKCECNKAKECPTHGEQQKATAKCQTYCRESACKCLHPCTSKLMGPPMRKWG